MRRGLVGIGSALVLVAAMATAGCRGSSGGSTSGSGGDPGSTGGSGGGAAGMGGNGGTGVASCSNVTQCGGDMVGTWTVTSSCLNVTGQLDLSLIGAGCPSAPVTGSLQVSGTLTVNSDGTYLDNTTTSGNEQIMLGASCLVVSSTPVSCSGIANIMASLGYASVSCTDAAGGGCSCLATVQQTGTIGSVSPAPSTNGNYTTSGNGVTISGDSGDINYPFCVSADMLTMTPQGATPTTTGTIVLQRSGNTGAAGDTGSGGSGRGGGTGSGGTTGSGGGGAGGKSGTGGTTGAGGAGGKSATGGQAGTGGKLGTGGAAGAAGKAGASGTGGSNSTTGPCDIYKSGGTPCVAAHSTVRALFGAYSGKLYQVRNAGGTTTDINAITAGGVADASAQDTFCSGTTCVVTIVYDQTGNGHDLDYQGSGSTVGGQDKPASATGESITVGGSKVYSLYIAPGNSYWTPATIAGIPTGSAPEGMYMVTSGKHYNSGCCFDYGNSESDRKADGAGAMDAINFSNITAWGTGAGSGPWVMADLEYGIFAQNNTNKNQNDPSQTATFVTAVLKNNGTTEFALKGGDATTGGLTTYYQGGLPAGWSPMKKQGAMVLGSGGDCCATNTNLSDGTFYEGCLVSGYPSDATETAVQSNIVAARYGR